MDVRTFALLKHIIKTSYIRAIHMQSRHNNYERYFKESEQSCQGYYYPYLQQFIPFSSDKPLRILDVGCGVGGNLAPFARMGHVVKGIDIDSNSIGWAMKLFDKEGLSGTFIHGDIHKYHDTERYDLIMLHDAIEHIPDKAKLITCLQGLLAEQGILYVAFPAWCMPFGGHQQVARTWFVSRCPFIHLLPQRLFVWLLRKLGEPESVIKDFLAIKATRMSIQDFQQLCHDTRYDIVNRKLYLINPHYKEKFGLTPRVLWKGIARIPYVRDFFSTSCHYLVTKKR